MQQGPSRLRREHRTIAAMLAIFCHDHHGVRRGLCPDCQGLLEYAGARLRRCCFQAEKPTCVNCPIHCYRPREREAVRVVMRYAGPRMLLRHPMLALQHLWDGWFRGQPQSRPGASGAGPSEQPIP